MHCAFTGGHLPDSGLEHHLAAYVPSGHALGVKVRSTIRLHNDNYILELSLVYAHYLRLPAEGPRHVAFGYKSAAGLAAVYSGVQKTVEGGRASKKWCCPSHRPSVQPEEF